MSDAHWGYGFPIGGVAAFSPENGVLSVGGVGFDGGCGVRTLKTNLKLTEIKPKIKTVVDRLFEDIPAGLGKRGEILLKGNEIENVLINGANWAVKNGFGIEEDLVYIEDNGKIEESDPKKVSETAIQREKRQIGTLGSGNHYLEVQYVDEIYDENAAKVFGLEKDQILISIHCGSRALGHQIGTDYLKVLADASRKYNIPIRERELVCAPINSQEGRDYFDAMSCALNYSYANRQVIAHLVRKTLKKIFPEIIVETFYDISHNSAKKEKHEIDGKLIEVYVHRKGSTRAYGPNRKEIPEKYREIGQPVIIGGTMGTESYILHGTEEGMRKSFGSACHGAGRAMSRNEAIKRYKGNEIIKELEKNGIYARVHSLSGLAEEAPFAYKNVVDVIESVHNTNIAKKVVRLKPIGNIKG
jgi:tRNA-splicing ligase RtcB